MNLWSVFSQNQLPPERRYFFFHGKWILCCGSLISNEIRATYGRGNGNLDPICCNYKRKRWTRLTLPPPKLFTFAIPTCISLMAEGGCRR
jgi:hypothetical protein